MELKVKVLPNGEGLELPRYHTTGAAGMDLRAAIPYPVLVPPNAHVDVPCGIAVEIPEGHEGSIRSRSGMVRNNGVVVMAGVGTNDSDYRGELSVTLRNHTSVGFTVTRGMRIAQLVIAPVVQVEVVEVYELSETERGEGGQGSTGMK